MYYTGSSIDYHNIVAVRCIAGLVFLHIFPGAVPCSKVAPLKAGWNNIYIVRFLHNAVVDGNILALAEYFFNGNTFSHCMESIFITVEQVIHFRQVLFKRVQDILYLPYEYAGVP